MSNNPGKKVRSVKEKAIIPEVPSTSRLIREQAISHREAEKSNCSEKRAVTCRYKKGRRAFQVRCDMYYRKKGTGRLSLKKRSSPSKRKRIATSKKKVSGKKKED